MPFTPRIQVAEEPGLRVVRFQDKRLFDDTTVRDVYDQIAGALPRSQETALVLDFSGVEAISSSMLGKLILVQRRMDALRGQLRLCDMTSTVRSVFSATNLDRLFRIDRDLNESRDALAESAV